MTYYRNWPLVLSVVSFHLLLWYPSVKLQTTSHCGEYGFKCIDNKTFEFCNEDNADFDEVFSVGTCPNGTVCDETCPFFCKEVSLFSEIESSMRNLRKEINRSKSMMNVTTTRKCETTSNCQTTPQCTTVQKCVYTAKSRTTPKCTTPKCTTPKCTFPKRTTPKRTTPKCTTPKCTTPKCITPICTTPKCTTPKCTTPKCTTPECTTPKGTTPESTTPECTTPKIESTTKVETTTDKIVTTTCFNTETSVTDDELVTPEDDYNISDELVPETAICSNIDRSYDSRGCKTKKRKSYVNVYPNEIHSRKSHVNRKIRKIINYIPKTNSTDENNININPTNSAVTNNNYIGTRNLPLFSTTGSMPFTSNRLTQRKEVKDLDVTSQSSQTLLDSLRITKGVEMNGVNISELYASSGNFPDPNNTQKYLYCDKVGRGEAFIPVNQWCPLGRVFNTTLRECVVPQISKPFNNIHNRIFRFIRKPFSCSKEGKFTVPHENNAYYLCELSEDNTLSLRKFICEDGTTFDSHLKSCVIKPTKVSLFSLNNYETGTQDQNNNPTMESSIQSTLKKIKRSVPTRQAHEEEIQIMVPPPSTSSGEPSPYLCHSLGHHADPNDKTIFFVCRPK